MSINKQRVKIDYTTYEGIMAGFADSVQSVIKEIEDRQKVLDTDPNNQDATARAWNTKQILKRWFRNNGGI